MFSRLTLGGWRQIKEFDLSFHPRLTVLTGANGSGKTTVLNLLSTHFGWANTFVSTPAKDRGTQGVLQYLTGFWKRFIRGGYEQNAEITVGRLTYTDGVDSELVVPEAVSPTYQVSIRPQQPVLGLHIPSHRPLYAYQQVSTIPTGARNRSDAFNQYVNLVRQRHQHGGGQSPTYYLKETLISLAVFGYGNEAVSPNIESATLFEEFQAVLRQVLPPKLGFERISIRIPEVVLVTRSDEFSLDAASGGVAAIVDLAWQIFMFAPRTEKFVVTIDEPENHLHPQLQRTLLSSFLAAFPEAQFIVATHNPFIVTSVPDSNVYVLRFDEDGKVISELLDTVNKAGSSNEILRDVLGLSSASPVWVETRLKALVDRYSSMDMTPETLQSLRAELVDLGLGAVMPSTVADIVDRTRK